MTENVTHSYDITENEKHLLNIIRKHRQISRTELSQKYKIPLSSLTRMTDGLLQKQLIVESSTREGNGRGRRQVMLELNYERFKSFGIEITRKRIKTVLLDLQATIYAESEIPISADPNSTLQKLAQVIQAMCRENGIPLQELLGVGIGTPGLLDRTSGTIIDFLGVEGWKSVQLVAQLKRHLDTRITIDFGANAAIMGEKWYGIGQKHKNIVYVNVDRRGVGCSIINNDTLIRHNNYDSMTLGHMIIDLHGGKCACGNNGCLELYTCEQAIIDTFTAMAESGEKSILIEDGQIKQNLSFAEIALSADRGDILSLQSISKAASILGIGLVNFINIVSPDLVIVGGSLLKRSEQYFNICVSVTKSKLFGNLKDQIVLSRNHLKKHAIPVGAGALVFDEYFSS